MSLSSFQNSLCLSVRWELWIDDHSPTKGHRSQKGHCHPLEVPCGPQGTGAFEGTLSVKSEKGPDPEASECGSKKQGVRRQEVGEDDQKKGKRKKKDKNQN